MSLRCQWRLEIGLDLSPPLIFHLQPSESKAVVWIYRFLVSLLLFNMDRKTIAVACNVTHRILQWPLIVAGRLLQWHGI